MTKIVVSGGSYTWGTTFLRDIFATLELKGSTIVLQDIVQDRVDLIYALAKKMMDAEQTISAEVL